MLSFQFRCGHSCIPQAIASILGTMYNKPFVIVNKNKNNQTIHQPDPADWLKDLLDRILIHSVRVWRGLSILCVQTILQRLFLSFTFPLCFCSTVSVTSFFVWHGFMPTIVVSTVCAWRAGAKQPLFWVRKKKIVISWYKRDFVKLYVLKKKLKQIWRNNAKAFTLNKFHWNNILWS